MDDDKFSLISTVQMKDPNTVLLVSIFLGVLGIDRFMIGDTGMGILKLLTCGCCGVLTIIDWFTISKKTPECCSADAELRSKPCIVVADQGGTHMLFPYCFPFQSAFLRCPCLLSGLDGNSMNCHTTTGI